MRGSRLASCPATAPRRPGPAGDSAIAAGLADAGIASEPAARAYGLAFIPLAAEHFDLVIPAGQAGTREVQALLKVLSSGGCSIS
jgi:molybdate-binding protein